MIDLTNAIELSRLIESGDITPIKIINEVWKKIENENESDLIFTQYLKKLSLSHAKKSTERAENNSRKSMFDGIPIALKDNFDIKDYVSSCGLKNSSFAKAKTNSFIYNKIIAAGLIPIGKTNMTELAFSGLGVNPQFGTPKNTVMADIDRAPGGSSSGSAIAVAKAIIPLGIGSDTGGSIRTPACWNNLVGIKLTHNSIDTTGLHPLSQFLDSIGIIGNNVADVSALTNILNNNSTSSLYAKFTSSPKLLVATNYFWEDINSDVKTSLNNCINTLNKKYQIDHKHIKEIDEITKILDKYGNIIYYEAYHNWKNIIENKSINISKEVRQRFEQGKKISATDYKIAKNKVLKLRQKISRYYDDYLAILTPTVVSTPPSLKEITDMKNYNKANLLSLKNTRIANLLNLPTITIPINNDKIPAGISLSAEPFSEISLCKLAINIEKAINE